MDIFRIIVCVALFASQSLAQTGGVDGIVASAGTEKADIEQVNAKKGCRSFEEMDAVGKSWLNFDCSKSSNNKVKKIKMGENARYLAETKFDRSSLMVEMESVLLKSLSQK